MADDFGLADEPVRIQLGNEDIRIAESYTVAVGIFTVPGAFALTLGHAGVVASLIKKFPPRTPFKLYVGETLVQTGLTDGIAAGGEASTVRIRGRDMMQLLHDSDSESERQYKETTYVELVRAVLKEAGLDPANIIETNAANRREATGGVAVATERIRAGKRKARYTLEKPATIKVGESYLTFLRRHLDRAGLFLFAAADGAFVLTAPDQLQPAIARLVHAPLGVNARGNVTNADFSNETTGRFSKALVYGRAGGKSFGRSKTNGVYVDQEMVDWGYNRVRTFRDVDTSSNERCENFARRKIAESRRQGWTLSMDAAGHTTPAILTGKRMVWCPDIIVNVKSDQYGLDRSMWVESMSLSRDSKTSTSLKLMRTEDLVFGTDD